MEILNNNFAVISLNQNGKKNFDDLTASGNLNQSATAKA
jgi:hypothetical protein